MTNEKLAASLAPMSCQQLMHLMDVLPSAFLFINYDGVILYANGAASTYAGAVKQKLFGNTLWQCAPKLVTTALYQAVSKVMLTRQPLEIKYRSPVNQSWLCAQLSPTDDGLALFFREEVGPAQPQDLSSRNEQMYRDLIENTSDAVIILTPDGLVLDINKRPLENAQLEREDVVGRPFADFPTWSYSSAVQHQLRSAIEKASKGETVRFESRVRSKAGDYLDIWMTITSHRDANRRVEYLICAGRDITVRKREEEELHALVDSIPHFIWMMRADGSAEYIGQRWCDYADVTPEQVEGDGWLECVHPDDRAHVREVWKAAIQVAGPYEVEYRIREGRTGEYRWFLARGVPLRNEQGVIQRWLGTCTDINKQKLAEQWLKDSEEKLRVLAETMPQHVWTARADGSITYYNHRYYEYLGVAPTQEPPFGQKQFIHPDDYERIMNIRSRSLKTGEPYEIEYRLKDGKAGKYRWFLSRALPVFDKAGQVVQWFGTSTDIDDQKCTEEALRQSQERVNVLMSSNIIGIFVSEGGQIVEANDTYLRMTGYTREDLQAGVINWVNMMPPEYADRTQQAFEDVAFQHYEVPFEKEYLCKDGSVLPVLVGTVALRFDPFQLIGFVLDNSARKELERRKDDFISMAGHELKTPLTALKLQTQLVKARLTRQGLHEAASDLVKVETPTKRLERLIGELLDVSKIQAGWLEYVQEAIELDILLQDVITTMQQMNPSYMIVLHGPLPSLTLLGDRERLEQVFANLISNAIKYSPNTRLIEFDVVASTDTVTVSVLDHGIGISNEQRKKIFERFYRGFDPRQQTVPGLGMGLYIASEIVKYHGGTISVESKVGKGSIFQVTLPINKITR